MNCKPQDGDKTWEKLKAQIARLSQMYNFPREPAAIRELVLALQTATSMEQAEEVVTAFLDMATPDTRCPMPAGIRAACKALQQDPHPDPLCQVCRGDGWRTITRGGLSGSERCRCWEPRPAPEIDYVRLPGQPGYVPVPDSMKMPEPKAEDRMEAGNPPQKVYGSPDEAA